MAAFSLYYIYRLSCSHYCVLYYVYFFSLARSSSLRRVCVPVHKVYIQVNYSLSLYVREQLHNRNIIIALYREFNIARI
uniref:Secreted protein n=1 Tax=Trichogramma kaykai TaxID=54128 RepID=A0ABD2XBU1_9HYME